jgi:hypothetical protein
MQQPDQDVFAGHAAWPAWHARAARILTFAGAALFAFAAWAPWITGLLVYTFGQPSVDGSNSYGSNSYDFSYDSSLGVYLLLAKLLRSTATYDPATASRLVSFAWGGVTAIGLLLAPLLWQRLRTPMRRLPLHAFAAWLAIATIATLALALVVWRYNPASQDPSLQIALTARRLGWGLWLALLGLASAWLGAVLLYREQPADEIAAVATPYAPASPRRRWAALALFTAGAGLWLLGFLAIPWVEVNCGSLQLTLNHLASGACGELDSADALSAQLVQRLSPNAWNLSEGIYPLYGALIGGAALLLLAVWRRPTSRVVALWAALWLAAASGTAFLAYRGVGVVITTSPALTTDASGAWNGATGVAVTLLGLVLAWLAILPMEGARWWAIGAAVPPPVLHRDPDLDPFATSGEDFEVTRLHI